MTLFSHAVSFMREAGSQTFGPRCFAEYKATHGIMDYSPTGQFLSIDSRSNLDRSLREEGIMIFRLGRRSGSRGTWFALAESPTGLDDYFLMDKEVFQNPLEDFAPGTINHLQPSWGLLGQLTETSAVNLAFSSGLIHYALELDPETIVAPATGASVYSFEVRPHAQIECQWEHQKGQVEVDAVFLGKRKDGSTAAYVIEAKADGAPSELAKHKLVYACSAIRDKVSAGVQIIPVYLRFSHNDGELTYHLCPCDLPAPSGGAPAVNELAPLTESSRSLRLKW